MALVQGNIAQDRKWDRAFEDHIFERYMTLSEAAVADHAELIVWPEAAAPFALPYLAVISEIVQSDLSTASAVSLLAGYNVVYALPFALVPGLIAIIGERAQPVLANINRFLERGTDLLMPWLMLALGLWLLADVYSYAAAEIFTGT